MASTPTTDTQTSISNQIYLSRDNIRNQIIELLQSYLDLKDVDLTKSSFLSFVVNIMSTLTSNLLFYEASVFKEFFLTQCQLPSSALNLATFIGYNASIASYSVAELLVTMPLTFDSNHVEINIPKDFSFYANDIKFQTYLDSLITVDNNSSVSVVCTENNKIFNLPVYLDTTATQTFSFIIPINQYQIIVQEFQIDSDIQTYQFVTQDVPFSGQISDILVEINYPNSLAWTIYTKFDSLYLMSATDLGYVIRRTSSGATLYFGNGLIGFQPIPGSTVRVTVALTEGENGNVIAGSITQGDRLYTQVGTNTELVSYTVVNPSPASGGMDEESTDQIKVNAIKNLTAMNRLVSETDYLYSDVVLKTAPITTPFPVLKRSDVKINEIQLYSALTYLNEIVPTRNLTYQTTTSNLQIPRGTIISEGETDFYTLFDLNVDLMNSCTFYDYTVYQVTQIVSLLSNYNSSYNLVANDLVITKNPEDSSVTFDLNYQTLEDSTSNITCTMTIQQGNMVYNMFNDPDNKLFSYTFPSYLNVPDGSLTYIFTIYHDGTAISQYSVNSIVRQDLKSFMLSNTSCDGTNVIIYDIPGIEKDYYDALNTVASKRDFELKVLQSMLTSFNFANYRMMTDFTNIKFTNTIGTMNNMQLNSVSQRDVIDIYITEVPYNPVEMWIGDRYIVTGAEGGAWTGKNGTIAECISMDNDIPAWSFQTCYTDDIVYVYNKEKKYIFSEGSWILMSYQIPLQISLEVFRAANYYGSDTDLSNSIKTALVTAFTPRFGSNIEVYRSEIISIVQSITGVNHCRLISPASNIFFNFNIDNFTQDELLNYSPEYVFFTSDDISIRLIQ
jgi:hypothetical protein